MSEEKFDKNRKAVAIVAVLALILLIAALSFNDRTAKPMAINGDMLGQETAEPLAQYVARAGESLEMAPAGEEVFALVTFSAQLGATRAAEVLSEVDRVNAMVMLSAAPMGLPEPIAGETRGDVFSRQLEQIQRSLDGIGDIQAPTEINGVIVRDEGEDLRALAEDPDVLSVEALPVDAGWGHFGVRPVYLDEVEPGEPHP